MSRSPTADTAGSSQSGDPINPRAADVAAIRLHAQEPEPTEPKGWREKLQSVASFTDGTAAEDGMYDTIDRVAAFAPAILVIRWTTTIASLALSVSHLTDDNKLVAVWCGVILAYTVIRTTHPIQYIGTVRSLVEVIGEVALLVVAVSTTGFWESPLLFSLLTAITVAGFARGFGFAVRIGLLASLAVSILFNAPHLDDPADIRLSAEWSMVLLLVALIAGYARRISGEADRQHILALDRLGRLADANALLFSLHRVTQTLPQSLDLDDVLDTTVGRLRGLFDFDFAAILVFDETAGDWQLVRREGTRLPLRLTTEELPPPLQKAIAEQGVISVRNLAEAGGPGLAQKASSGLYGVLPARGSLIGLIAVEHQNDQQFSSRDVELVKGFVEPVALAIDNARWFGRLRTVGADEERTRIARDLHDNIGQSLAYLAFELDRIVNSQAKGDEIGTSLERLRDDVRGVIREVRDTLYDLRTDVSDKQDMADILEAYAARVTERTGIEIELYCDRDARLPILQEREMWRVAQEAVTNIERHSGATRVRILWRCNGESAALDITDNGTGFPIGRAGRLDSYGILGMRERASSIGAALELTSEPGKGTRVRCTLLRAQHGENASASSASRPAS
jgi:signal transduction histidine kinase